MNAETLERLNQYCETSGQSKAVTAERVVNGYIDKYENKMQKLKEKRKTVKLFVPGFYIGHSFFLFCIGIANTAIIAKTIAKIIFIARNPDFPHISILSVKK